MEFSRLLRTKTGFTLAETMIGLGVSMIVLLGIAQSFDMLSRGKKSIEAGADANEWIQDVRQAMGTTQCKAMLVNKTFPGSAGGSITMSSLAMNGNTYAVGGTMGRGLILKSVRLISNGGGVATTYEGGASKVAAKSYVGVLRVEIQKPAQSLGGTAMQPAYIPMRLMTDNSNKILDCMTVNDMSASTCAELNFVWDGATKQCRYRLGQCQYAGSYVGGNTNGTASGGFTNPFTSGYSCPTGKGYQARVAGSFNKAVSCGKGCVRNLIAPVYECVKCYDAGGSQIAPGATAALTYVPADITAGSDIDDSTADVNTALVNAITGMQSTWVASGNPCYASGTVFAGSCNTSGGGYTETYATTMCCSGSVKVCRNGFLASVSGEPAERYYVPNYMGCN